MSLKQDLYLQLAAFDDVDCVETVMIDKDASYHGQSAVKVTAVFESGLAVQGTFTTDKRGLFGGVQESDNKNIIHLFTKKVDQVMRGTHDSN